MNKAAIKTISWVLLTALIAGILLISWVAKDLRETITCSKLEVEFTDSLKFIDEDNVRTYLDRNYGTYIGQKIDSVNLNQIEELFTKRNSITGAQAWITDDGTLHLNISQRKPVLRFMNGENGFYIDNEAFIFPLHKTFIADVPVIEGKIPFTPEKNYSGFPINDEDKIWLEKMLELNKLMRDNKKWFGNIEHILIRNNGDLAFMIKNNEEIFIFGDISDFKEKTSLIDEYFKSIAPLNDYKTVNLKYKKQIICRTDI